jgi:peroxiredoxin/glutaredoxin
MKILDNKIKDFNFKIMENGEWKELLTSQIFKNKRVIVLALPGAFTPTCTTTHLPRYEELYDTLMSEGIDEVYCLSVNDTFVMNAWFKEVDVKKIKALPDGTGEFTKSLGMLVNKDELGFGQRSWRYSMVIDNGLVEKAFIEDNVEGDPFKISDADTMLNYINPKAKKPESNILITRNGCPYCDIAKKHLDLKGIKYKEISKNENGVDAIILRGLTGNSTYPQLIISGYIVGGSENILKL